MKGEITEYFFIEQCLCVPYRVSKILEIIRNKNNTNHNTKL